MEDTLGDTYEAHRGYISISRSRPRWFVNDLLKDFLDCTIVATKGKYFPQPVAWPFPKHSPYLPLFNFYIKELIEKGQWNSIIEKDSFHQGQNCPDLSGKPIEFANCFSAFLLIIFGILTSFSLFLGELVFGKKRLKKAKKVDFSKWDRFQLEYGLIQAQENIKRLKKEILHLQK